MTTQERKELQALRKATLKFLKRIADSNADCRFSESARKLVMDSVEDFQDALAIGEPSTGDPA